MYKLIAILAAAIPFYLFVKSVFFRRSKAMERAFSEFRRQVDYLVWAILLVVGCTVVYSIGKLIYPMWN